MYPIIASNFLNLLREITEKLFSIGPKYIFYFEKIWKEKLYKKID